MATARHVLVGVLLCCLCATQELLPLKMECDGKHVSASWKKVDGVVEPIVTGELVHAQCVDRWTHAEIGAEERALRVVDILALLSGGTRLAKPDVILRQLGASANVNAVAAYVESIGREGGSRYGMPQRVFQGIAVRYVESDGVLALVGPLADANRVLRESIGEGRASASDIVLQGRVESAISSIVGAVDGFNLWELPVDGSNGDSIAKGVEWVRRQSRNAHGERVVEVVVHDHVVIAQLLGAWKSLLWRWTNKDIAEHGYHATKERQSSLCRRMIHHDVLLLELALRIDLWECHALRVVERSDQSVRVEVDIQGDRERIRKLLKDEFGDVQNSGENALSVSANGLSLGVTFVERGNRRGGEGPRNGVEVRAYDRSGILRGWGGPVGMSGRIGPEGVMWILVFPSEESGRTWDRRLGEVSDVCAGRVWGSECQAAIKALRSSAAVKGVESGEYVVCGTHRGARRYEDVLSVVWAYAWFGSGTR